MKEDPKWDTKGGSKRVSKRGSKKVYGAKKENHCGMGKYCLYSTYVLMNLVTNMLLTEICYFLEDQVFGGVNNRDMSLIEMCIYSRFTVFVSVCLSICPFFKEKDKVSCQIISICQSVHLSILSREGVDFPVRLFLSVRLSICPFFQERE